ncbi:hypothetical protein F1188_14865 [Roseospira marina]|uniref:Uncharacterized protein n=1 Tax=Roseospira marina TaxID=140057 RepID=A0A5M6I916_9PROT|nr:hypothetical protein [Roseospira marina]KAA5604691.1 hypothetical protein F1188_14865 [Roseospira marina]MBB4315139.1 hypothetical protein [Roseospira marina]MBB5088091.1 hypothetical protein [Roseospira marina]
MLDRVLGATLSAAMASALALTLAMPAQAQSTGDRGASDPLAQSPGLVAPMDDPLDMNRAAQPALPADAPACSVPTGTCEDFDQSAEDLRRRLLDAVAQGDEGNVLADLLDDGLCEAEEDALEQALATMAQESPEASAAVVRALVSEAMAAAETNGQAAVNLLSVALVAIPEESPVTVVSAGTPDTPADPLLDGDFFAQLDEAYQRAEAQALADGCVLQDTLAGFETAAGGAEPNTAPADVFGRTSNTGGSDPGPLPFNDVVRVSPI